MWRAVLRRLLPAAPPFTAWSVRVKLDEIEAEMKRAGLWHPDPPDVRSAYDRGEARSYLDAPTFELWLQCVFLPNARAAVETRTFPTRSQVGLMALRQYDYHEHVPHAQRLLRLLHEFDDRVAWAAVRYPSSPSRRSPRRRTPRPNRAS